MPEETAERVRKVIATILKIPVERVVPHAHLVRNLGMESVQSVELIAALEEEFDVEIDSDSVRDILTVETATAYMKKAVGQ